MYKQLKMVLTIIALFCGVTASTALAQTNVTNSSSKMIVNVMNVITSARAWLANPIMHATVAGNRCGIRLRFMHSAPQRM
jgi:hypothetical protein